MRVSVTHFEQWSEECGSVRIWELRQRGRGPVKADGVEPDQSLHPFVTSNPHLYAKNPSTG